MFGCLLSFIMKYSCRCYITSIGIKKKQPIKDSETLKQLLYFNWSCFELFWSMHISWNIYHLVYILDVFASLRVSCSDSRIEIHIIVMDLGSEITSVMKRNYMWLISNQRECNYIFVLKITKPHHLLYRNFLFKGREINS